MTRVVRSFLAMEAALFGAASLLHAGVLLQGYEHAKAATAESVIALVLVAALGATSIAPSLSRGIGLSAQGLALIGTLVGVFTIAIGVGPRTLLDFGLHAVMIGILALGCLWLTRRHMVA